MKKDTLQLDKVDKIDRSSYIKKLWWWGSDVGISEKVLPPWTSITVQRLGKDLDVSPWGRRYIFDSLIFPSQIESRDSLFLSSPVRIIVQVKGEETKWKGYPIQIEEKRPGQVTFFQRAESTSLVLTARTRLEYDGIVKIDWGIKPRCQVELEGLIFEIPLKKEHAKYLYHYYFPFREGQAPCNSGELSEKGFETGFCPFIWLGDEDRGFSWFCESDKNWYNEETNKITTIIPERDRVILRLHLVSIPLELAPGGKSSNENRMVPPHKCPLGDLNYTFGFQSTPVKLIEKDVWDYRITNIAQRTFTNTPRLKVPGEILDKLTSLGVRTVCFHEHWTDPEGYYTTEYEDDLKNLVQACHKKGMQFLLYFRHLISDITPEWPSLWEECVVLPKDKGCYTPYNYPCL